MLRLFTNIKRFASSPPSNFDLYLQSKDSKIRIPERVRGSKTKLSISDKIIIPRSEPDIQSIKSNFSGKWRGKPLVFSIDSSATIGLKRQHMRKHMVEQVYKGVSEPNELLHSVNPIQQQFLEELLFEPHLFFMSDPDVRMEGDEGKFKEQIIRLYEKEPTRLPRRLNEDLKVPRSYLSLFECAMYSQSPIYFGGLNEYILRFVLGQSYTLDEIKILFFESLKYSLTNSTQPDDFQHFARQHLYSKAYSLIQKIENAQMNKILNSMKEAVVFGPSYILENLENRQNVDKLTEYGKDSEDDQKRIEKQAILEVMLGKLWVCGYTRNPFPYITDKYEELNEEDKQLLSKMFKDFCVRYKGAMKLFYKKSVASSAQ